ncbi:hypothetical protein [Vineibacter terrae]|uniref:hypothetical protein n=1 Tax=Vineibacter terrae TaxID=2586908 RepID=UPI002E344353|nr:hypothetical protein [Vineibacter terrae]HEX2885514.1 hypothetical protein [Vineibacter terrae]
MAEADAPPPGGASGGDTVRRARRVRSIAVWSVALFVAAVPVAFVSASLGNASEAQTGSLLALLFWLSGFVAAVWAFVVAFRHWDTLPLGTRWLASLPLLVVLTLIALVMLALVSF